ncbi:DNA repair protein XRCC2-like protein, partial [Bienertia sinuspersici]
YSITAPAMGLEQLEIRVHDIVNCILKGRMSYTNARDWICDEELIQKCLERFLYVRCYDSLEFLATLKTLSYKLQTKQLGFASKVSFMMIDSIGAYYWIDRASTSMPLGSSNRKIFSLQSVTEAVVCEIQNFVRVHPMLVFGYKSYNIWCQVCNQ